MGGSEFKGTQEEWDALVKKDKEDNKTAAVKACKTFGELEEVIRKHAPFISTSRPDPIEWGADKIIRRIFLVIDGDPAINVTRANGLRDKVVKLLQKTK